MLHLLLEAVPVSCRGQHTTAVLLLLLIHSVGFATIMMGARKGGEVFIFDGEVFLSSADEAMLLRRVGRQRSHGIVSQAAAALSGGAQVRRGQQRKIGGAIERRRSAVGLIQARYATVLMIGRIVFQGRVSYTTNDSIVAVHSQ